MNVLITFAALFASVALLQVSSGAVGPLDAISGAALGFSTAEIGFLGSAHYIGFFIGCWGAPRLLGTVGHSRAFAAFTAAGAIGLLAHMMVVHPLAWAGLRISTGLCVAGCYTVIESWLNARVTNETRGRATGVYRIVDLGAALVAQLMIAVLPPAAYVSYNLLAILCCLALLPIALTQASQPEVPSAPRLRPALAFLRSPLAGAAVIVAGLTSAAFRMVGPVYGQEVGLRLDQIGLFLAAYVLGGALAQYPVGWLADRFDRRHVLVGLSVAAMASCAVTISTQTDGTLAVFGAAFLFGVTTFPIYSVAAAHAHDFADDNERVELSAALMFVFAVGAIASPLVSSLLIDAFGPMALFVFLGLGHLGLVLFSLARMRVRPAPKDRTDYVYVPRTSFTIGRLLGRKR